MSEINDFALDRRADFTATMVGYVDLSRDASGAYISHWTRQAWHAWLRQHPDPRVVTSFWKAARRPGDPRGEKAHRRQDAMVVAANTAYAADTVDMVAMRMRFAAKAGGQLFLSQKAVVRSRRAA
ncbi:MAG TPA: hypothetical protein VF292_03900 [Rhodanobacteraceae bacterium]